jgi:hypothetical protein
VGGVVVIMRLNEVGRRYLVFKTDPPRTSCLGQSPPRQLYSLRDGSHRFALECRSSHRVWLVSILLRQPWGGMFSRSTDRTKPSSRIHRSKSRGSDVTASCSFNTLSKSCGDPPKPDTETFRQTLSFECSSCSALSFSIRSVSA